MTGAQEVSSTGIIWIVHLVTKKVVKNAMNAIDGLEKKLPEIKEYLKDLGIRLLQGLLIIIGSLFFWFVFYGILVGILWGW